MQEQGGTELERGARVQPSLGAEPIIDVGDADFEAAVVERSKQLPVVVDFWAPWCGPCRMLGPLLEQLARERAGGFVLAKVDIDQAPRLAQRYGIRSIPAVQAWVDGAVVDSFEGALSAPRVRQFIDRLAPDPLERRAKQAQARAAQDPAGAEAELRAVLEASPRHERASVALAGLLLDRGRDEEAQAVLDGMGLARQLQAEVEKLEARVFLARLGRESGGEAAARASVEADPKDARARWRLGCALAAAARYEEALASLLEAAKLDKKLGQTEAREAMVKVFFAIGARDPLADRYRQELARAIY